MSLFVQYGRWLIGTMTLMAVLSVSGCSGITPDGNLRNDREEGPEHGIFSGPGGEFVIVAPGSAVTKKNAEGAETVKSHQ